MPFYRRLSELRAIWLRAVIHARARSGPRRSATARYAAPTSQTGYYVVTATVRWSVNANGGRSLLIERFDAGGSNPERVAVSGDVAFDAILLTNDQSVAGIVPLNPGQSVNVEVWQSSGGTLNVKSAEASFGSGS